jgi:type IV pilus assembly protein PilW
MAPSRPLLARAGFTLPELLVAIAVIGVVMAGLVSLLVSGQQSVSEGSNLADAQQSARIAVNRMMQEIRGAGYNPSGDPLLFSAITAQSATGFTIQNDWNGNGVIETNVTTTVSGVGRGEQVTYFVVGNTLRRRESNIDPAPCNGATDLTCVIAPTEQVTLQYLDATDAVTTVAANIRTIVVTLQVRPQIQPTSAVQGAVLASMTDRARIRNR